MTPVLVAGRHALPHPRGPHPVGRMSMECTDPGRFDPYAADPATRRELVLWIWYPAEPSVLGAAGRLPPRSVGAHRRAARHRRLGPPLPCDGGRTSR